MKIIGLEILEAFWSKHADAKSALRAWYHEALGAAWRRPQDIKMRYPSASFLRNNHIIFNIKGNRYRLNIQAHYAAQTIRIAWIGSHAEYDKRKIEI